MAKARSAGGRALRLDPASSEALASLAVLRYAFDHDWAGAERDFERGLALNPSYARGHLQYATGLVTRARFDAAIVHIRAARNRSLPRGKRCATTPSSCMPVFRWESASP
jgi:Tfp pilus assembly protein PilF